MRLRRDVKLELVKRVPLFAGLSKRELARVASIFDEIDFRPGKRLIREGDVGREFFILADGSAEIRRGGRKIDTARPGDFFGEAALLTRARRNATVTTTSPARALVTTETNFKHLLREHPSISIKVLEALAHRLPAGSHPSRARQ